MTVLKVGIAGYDEMKARTLAVARGERRAGAGEPKVWFTSLESFARILSEPNRALLELIDAEKPESLTELAKLSGRAKSNLSRTLSTMARYGLVELHKDDRGRVVPRVPYSEIVLEMPIVGRKAGTDSAAA